MESNNPVFTTSASAQAVASDFYFYLGALAAAIAGFIARHYGWQNMLLMYNGFIWGWGHIKRIRGVVPVGDIKEPFAESIAEDGGIQAVNEKQAIITSIDDTEDDEPEPTVYKDPIPPPRLYRRDLFEPEAWNARRVVTIQPVPFLDKVLPTSDPVSKVVINGVQLPVLDGSDAYRFVHCLARGTGDLNMEVSLVSGKRIDKFTCCPSIQAGARTTLSSDRKLLRWSLSDFQWRRHGYWIVNLNDEKRVIILIDEADDTPRGDNVFELNGIDTSGNENVTRKIQEALDRASEFGKRNGGQGIVVLPEGRMKVGNLVIDSNTRLHFSPGAVIWTTENKRDYKMEWKKDSTGKEHTYWISTKHGSRNISITGRGGLINCRGRDVRNKKNGEGFAANVIVPIATSGFIYDGPTIRDGSSWTVVPIRSRNLKFRNLKILNRHNLQENDGIDVNESQNCSVYRSIVCSLDDCYSTKSWETTTDVAKKWPGEQQNVTNVTFDNCISWTRCFGFKVGAGVGMPQSNISFRNSTVYECAIGFGIMGSFGTATVSDIHFYNITVENIPQSLEKLSSWFRGQIKNGHELGGNNVRNVLVEKIDVRHTGSSHVDISGLNGNRKFEGIVFKDIRFPDGRRPRRIEDLNIKIQNADRIRVIE